MRRISPVRIIRRSRIATIVVLILAFALVQIVVDYLFFRAYFNWKEIVGTSIVFGVIAAVAMKMRK